MHEDFDFNYIQCQLVPLTKASWFSAHSLRIFSASRTLFAMRTFTSVAELSLKSAHLRGSAWVGCAGVHHLVTLKTCVPLSAFTPVTQFVSNGHKALAVRQNRKHLILVELDFRLALTRVTHILLADVVENLNNSINSC